MRILTVIASLAESGGAEMLARNLSLAYARAGHRCHIAYISDAASLGASADYEAAFKAQMDAAGITYAMIGHDAKRRPWRGGWRLRRIVRAFRPDVMHVHLATGLLFQAFGMVRVPTVYTHHNIVLKFPPALFRLFDRFVDRYVAICDACGVLLTRHVGRPIVPILNGVPDDFAAPAPAGRPHDALMVLSVGNLTPQKDYPTLLAAARRIVDHFAGLGRPVRFRIAGEGSERAALEARIAADGLGDHVELLGARRDVPALMAEADLLMMTSAFEGLPITLIETAKSALPAVATDVGGCGDVVADGVSGRLVPPGDPAAAAGAAIAILSDPDLRARYAAAAAERAGMFSLASCAAAYQALYAAVIAERLGRKGAA